MSDLGPLTSRATPASPAYMIYTSGSTGKPKGVQISNRALMAFCSAIVKLWNLGPENRIAVAAHEYVAPRAGAEKTIAEAWGELLKIERYGATDDFFASGGTSLLGIKAVVALQKAGPDVQYGDLFKHKTPRALAVFLGDSGQGLTALPGSTDSQPSAFAPGGYDYAPIDALLAKTRTDLFGDFRVHSLGDVLLTGATGYLGIHVLRYLLEKTSSSVTVLLRPKGKIGHERRLDAQYVYYLANVCRAASATASLMWKATSYPFRHPLRLPNPTVKQSNNQTIFRPSQPSSTARRS